MKETIKQLTTRESNALRRTFEAINRAQQLKTFLEATPLMCRDKFLDVLDEELELTKHNWEVELKRHNLPLNDPTYNVDWDTGLITKEVDDASDSESSNTGSPDTSGEDSQLDGVTVEPRPISSPVLVE